MKNGSKRSATSRLETPERLNIDEFNTAKRDAEASSEFVRVAKEDGVVLELTGTGDVNTYALFAELFAKLSDHHGRSGIIVPPALQLTRLRGAALASLFLSACATGVTFNNGGGGAGQHDHRRLRRRHGRRRRGRHDDGHDHHHPDGRLVCRRG